MSPTTVATTPRTRDTSRGAVVPIPGRKESLVKIPHVAQCAGVFVATIVVTTAAVSLRDPHPPHAEPAERGHQSTGVTIASAGNGLDGLLPTWHAIQWVAAIETNRAAAVAQAAVDEALAVAQAQEAELERQGAELAQVSQVVEASSGGDWSDTMACIRHHESDTAGGYQAFNPSSGAAGAYQALASTWDGYGGYQSARDAPPDVQDAWAIEALNAAGTQPWNGSGC